MPPPDSSPQRDTNPYAGWIAASLVIVGVLAVGAVLWFSYHPI
ncbi:MAG: hypothetical protein ACLPZM_01760 [Thermoplasmata archaeon]